MAPSSRTSRPALVAPVSPVLHGSSSVAGGGLEIRFLWRYVAVAALMAACALLSAWSRVDLVETAVALDQSRASYAEATAEQERLQLELATLTDPHHLRAASAALAFEGAAHVVDVPQGTP
jgi:hypothetical protein